MFNFPKASCKLKAPLASTRRDISCALYRFRIISNNWHSRSKSKAPIFILMQSKPSSSFCFDLLLHEFLIPHPYQPVNWNSLPLIIKSTGKDFPFFLHGLNPGTPFPVQTEDWVIHQSGVIPGSLAISPANLQQKERPSTFSIITFAFDIKSGRSSRLSPFRGPASPSPETPGKVGVRLYAYDIGFFFS